MSIVVVDQPVVVPVVYCYEGTSKYTNLSLVVLRQYDVLAYQNIPLYSYNSFHFTVRDFVCGSIVCEFLYDSLVRLPVKRYFIVNEDGNLVFLSGKNTAERIVQYLNGFISEDEIKYYCSSLFNDIK